MNKLLFFKKLLMLRGLMSSGKNLREAKKNKNDEFYTQLEDIEKELSHYSEQFKGKTILCNCDDPYESNFFKYFVLNFNRLGIKRLISTCYNSSPIAGSEFDDLPLFKEALGNKHGYKIIVDKVEQDPIKGLSLSDIQEMLKDGRLKVEELKGNGDYASEECLKLLDESDVVVSNPPFSFFRQYIATLVEHNKKFLIIGNMNAITYKEVFKLIKENKVWLGYSFNKTMTFRVPEYYKHPDNTCLVKVPSITRFTNLEVKKRHEFLPCWARYDKDKYPKYDNYDAINVDKVAEIPGDYDGVMGVPITFLGSYNPNQFDIVALGIVGSIEFAKNIKMEILKNGLPTGKFTYNAKGTLYMPYSKADKKPPAFKNVETGELYQSIYARILIKKVAK